MIDICYILIFDEALILLGFLYLYIKLMLFR